MGGRGRKGSVVSGQYGDSTPTQLQCYLKVIKIPLPPDSSDGSENPRARLLSLKLFYLGLSHLRMP